MPGTEDSTWDSLSSRDLTSVALGLTASEGGHGFNRSFALAFTAEPILISGGQGVKASTGSFFAEHHVFQECAAC
jgi:hypothetical protein